MANIHFRRRPIDICKKLPVVRSNKELSFDDEGGTSVSASAFDGQPKDDEQLSIAELKARTTDIPVPQCSQVEPVPLPEPYRPPPQYHRTKARSQEDVFNDVEYDLDRADLKFLNEFNASEKGKNNQLSEHQFEACIDRFDKQTHGLGEMVPLVQVQKVLNVKPVALAAMHTYWIQRRIETGQCFLRRFQPPPDPDDPDPYVAFRPREREGGRKRRSNNQRSFNQMKQLRDEFDRVGSILELIKKREMVKQDHLQISNELIEVQINQIMHKLQNRSNRSGAGSLPSLDTDDRPLMKEHVSSGWGRGRGKGYGPGRKKMHKGTHLRGKHWKQRGAMAAAKRAAAIEFAKLTREQRLRERERVEEEQASLSHKIKVSFRTTGGGDVANSKELKPYKVDLDKDDLSSHLVMDVATREDMKKFLPQELLDIVNVNGAKDARQDVDEEKAFKEIAWHNGGRGGLVRIGRGGRVIFDRNPKDGRNALYGRGGRGRGGRIQKYDCVGHGGVLVRSMTAVDPDESWRHHGRWQIPRNGLLFNFQSGKANGADASEATGQDQTSNKSDDSDSSCKENNCTDPNATSSSQNGRCEFVLSDKVLNDTWLMGLMQNKNRPSKTVTQSASGAKGLEQDTSNAAQHPVQPNKDPGTNSTHTISTIQ